MSTPTSNIVVTDSTLFLALASLARAGDSDLTDE
jgi:hypothetical protein